MSSINSSAPNSPSSAYRFQSTANETTPNPGRRSWIDIVLFKEAGRTKAWYGVLALATMCAWLGYVGLHTLLGEHDLAQAISATRGNTVVPVLIVFIAVILLAEQFWPAVPRPILSRAHLVDLS